MKIAGRSRPKDISNSTKCRRTKQSSDRRAHAIGVSPLGRTPHASMILAKSMVWIRSERIRSGRGYSCASAISRSLMALRASPQPSLYVNLGARPRGHGP
jgi:hypothetical protein